MGYSQWRKHWRMLYSSETTAICLLWTCLLTIAQNMYNIQIKIFNCCNCAYSNRDQVTFRHKVTCVLNCYEAYSKLRNKNQPDSLYFIIYSNKYPLHVSNILTIHHQQAVHSTCSLWHLSRNHADRVSSQSTWMHDKYNRLHVQ